MRFNIIKILSSRPVHHPSLFFTELQVETAQPCYAPDFTTAFAFKIRKAFVMFAQLLPLILVLLLLPLIIVTFNFNTTVLGGVSP